MSGRSQTFDGFLGCVRSQEGWRGGGGGGVVGRGGGVGNGGFYLPLLVFFFGGGGSSKSEWRKDLLHTSVLQFQGNLNKDFPCGVYKLSILYKPV